MSFLEAVPRRTIYIEQEMKNCVGCIMTEEAKCGLVECEENEKLTVCEKVLESGTVIKTVSKQRNNCNEQSQFNGVMREENRAVTKVNGWDKENYAVKKVLQIFFFVTVVWTGACLITILALQLLILDIIQLTEKNILSTFI